VGLGRLFSRKWNSMLGPLPSVRGRHLMVLCQATKQAGDERTTHGRDGDRSCGTIGFFSWLLP
jgi:hypothetical protein